MLVIDNSVEKGFEWNENEVFPMAESGADVLHLTNSYLFVVLNPKNSRTLLV